MELPQRAWIKAQLSKRTRRVDEMFLIDICYFLPLSAVFEGNVKDHRTEYIQPVRTLVLA